LSDPIGPVRRAIELNNPPPMLDKPQIIQTTDQLTALNPADWHTELNRPLLD
jgi:hypothetical protein